MEDVAKLHIEKLPEGANVAISDAWAGSQSHAMAETVEVARDAARIQLESRTEHNESDGFTSTTGSFDNPLIPVS